MRAAAVAVLALALAAAAAAQTPTVARVCGSNLCRSFSDSRVRGLASWPGYRTAVRVPKPAPYFVIHLLTRIDRAPALTYVWVPSRSLVRIGEGPVTYWSRLPAAKRPLLAALTKGLEPYRARARWAARY